MTDPGDRAGEGDQKMVVSNGLPDQGNSLDRLARVQARAREVDPKDRRARIRFLRSLGSDYERGVTPAACAEVWGLKVSTVESDSSIAWMAIQDASDPVDTHVFYAELYENLDSARAFRSSMQEVIGNLRDPASGKLMVRKAMDMKFIADGMGRAIESIDKVLVTLGRASGVLKREKGSDVNVYVDQSGALRPELAALLDVVMRALAPFPDASMAVAQALRVWRDSLTGARQPTVVDAEVDSP